MKAKDYRRQVEAEMAAAREAGAAASEADAPAGHAAGDEHWSSMIDLLKDSSAPTGERLAALKSLQAATFLGDAFDRCRADYVGALRAVATEAEPSLRRRAFDILASMKDEFARQRMVAGLSGDEEPLLPAAAALGLLARDDHASVGAIARDILARAKDRFTRAQAVRLLSSDPTAKPVFEALMASKDEFREVRQASAAALRNIDPQAFLARARELLADPAEFSDIQETLRGAFERAGIVPPPAARRANRLARAAAWIRGLLGNRARR